MVRPRHHEEAPDSEGFSFWVTVAFTLNYILGSGFLTLPWTFEKTGIILGIIVLAVIGFFSTLSVFFILETIDRGQRLLKYVKDSGVELASLRPSTKSHQKYVQIRDSSYHNPDDLTEVIDKEALVADVSPSKANAHRWSRHFDGKEAAASPLHSTTSLSRADVSESEEENSVSSLQSLSDLEIIAPHDRKLEIVELTSMFLGPWGQHAYAAIIIIYMYGTLWAYCVVFAKAFASHLPIFASPYVFYVVVFGMVVIPVSLMEFKEQVAVQVSLSIFRIVMVSVMVATCIVAQANGDNEFSLPSEQQSRSSLLWKFEPSKMYYLLPVAAYAYIFHHSVPSLADTSSDKVHLSHLFRTALVISMIAYMTVGAIVALYFGRVIETTSNLNWESYRGVGTMDGAGVPLYASIISFFVVLFPAIDVASAYPLNAYTLGNNLMSMYYGNEMHKHESSRWKLSIFRSLAAVPPIFGGLLYSKVEKITAYTGLTAFGLAFIFPPLLARFSAKTLVNIGLPVSTPHSGFWTTDVFQYLLFVSGIVIFLVVLTCLQLESAK
jgi:amino acid permease